MNILLIVILIFIILFILYLIYKELYYQKYLILKTFQNHNKKKDINDIIFNNYNNKGINNIKYYNNIDYGNQSVEPITGKTDGCHNIGILKRHILSNPYEHDFHNSPCYNKEVVLDCGPGTGAFCDYLIYTKKLKIKYYGITNSINQYNFLIKKYKYIKNISIIYDSFDNIDKYIKKESINRVYFLETHGYSLNRYKLYQKIYNILKYNGTIYIKSPGCNNKFNQKTSIEMCKFWNYNLANTYTNMYDLNNIGFHNIQYQEISLLSLFILEPLLGITNLLSFFYNRFLLSFYYNSNINILIHLKRLIKELFLRNIYEYYIIAKK